MIYALLLFIRRVFSFGHSMQDIAGTGHVQSRHGAVLSECSGSVLSLWTRSQGAFDAALQFVAAVFPVYD
jgi:hypothetical protein